MLEKLRFPILAIALASMCAFACTTVNAYSQESGQRNFSKESVEPALDYANGSTIYLLTPHQASVAFQGKSDSNGAPIFAPVSPVFHDRGGGTQLPGHEPPSR